MRRKAPHPLVLAALVGMALIVVLILSESGAFNVDIWKRENPLANAIPVRRVLDGALSLADGRSFRPAGITRRETVSRADFDAALTTITAQGIVVIRDLGDGRALLMAEPKFYNWCGTRNYRGNPWARWAGSFLQCPVSELLIQSGYAAPALDQPGFTPLELWRLEGALHASPQPTEPTQLSSTLTALRYDGSSNAFDHYDEFLEAVWKPPPNP